MTSRWVLLWRSGDGRVRLGWRLVGFIGVATVVLLPMSAITPSGVVGGSTAVLVAALLSGWWWLHEDGRSLGALGFHVSSESAVEALKGLALGTAIALVVVGLMVVTGGLRWASQGGTVGSWLEGAGTAALFLVIPAAAEEAMLRGYPLQAVAEAWGAGVAIWISAIAFGLLHLPNPGSGLLSTVNVAAAGLMLGVVYVKTASLWWATGVHLGWNWAHGYIADVPVSGLELMDAPFYEGITRGPVWLGGGGFGPEGSVMTTVVVIVVTAGLWWGPFLRPGAAARAANPLIPLQAESEISNEE